MRCYCRIGLLERKVPSRASNCVTATDSPRIRAFANERSAIATAS